MMASELITLLPGAVMKGPDIAFTALRADSSLVKPGDAFVALKGSKTDGHAYIGTAVESGATVVLCSKEVSPERTSITSVIVPDTKQALEILLPVLYPLAREVSLVGITGTNGKTTITYLVETVLRHAGNIPGIIGTITTRYPGTTLSSTITTPGPIDLFERLHAMNRAGVDTCIMEVSSHALDQNRVAGLEFACAVFTNLSQDHLDYHKDMEAYFLAKKRLFENYLSGDAIINVDDPFGKRLYSEYPSAVTFGRDPEASIRLLGLASTTSGLSLSLSSPAGDVHISSPLLGEMNAYNIMAAFGVCLSRGIDPGIIVSGIEALDSVPGRMEKLNNPFHRTIIVDFAHTPEALRTALASARGFTDGRIICVFGCGGDRDKTKRPLMGKIASSYSDVTIVTSDNPRTEDPSSIIEDILTGIDDRSTILVEPDRAGAIRKGIMSMNSADCLIIAGKGHEDYQIIGHQKTPFDDKVRVREVLEEVFGPW
ncbi:MAG: UDP-N-acetylmuramoyl-L-alanyl-D-glutamate--2,6-diaminopimelate ligase [Desulfomonilia bacterium]